MGLRRTPFAVGEWYHCYNRGIDKRTAFRTTGDYERFLQLLYLTNTPRAVHRSNIPHRVTEDIVRIPREATLVSIGAYCLMQNHFHLLLHEHTEGGIATFMQKIGTAYAMYFNIKNDRTGNLFNKPFKSRHVGDDRYFQYVIQYIHLNPATLFEPRWKEGFVGDMRALESALKKYRYSSYADFMGETRAIKSILAPDVFDVFRPITSREMLEEARAYYEEISSSKEFRDIE